MDADRQTIISEEESRLRAEGQGFWLMWKCEVVAAMTAAISNFIDKAREYCGNDTSCLEEH